MWFETVLDKLRAIRYLRHVDQFITIAACSCMMLWSVLFPGWLSLVLLVWAAALCLFPAMKRRTLRSAPFVVAFAVALLCVQFVAAAYPVSEHLTEYRIDEYGLRDAEEPTAALVVKSLFTVVFFALARQNKFRESASASDAPRRSSMFKGETPVSLWLLECTREGVVQLWIFVVVATLACVILVGSAVTLVRVVYALLFLCFVFTFQFSYNGWRNLLSAYWLTLGVFTLLCLIMEYSYSFERIRKLWSTHGVSPELQKKIGFGGRDTYHRRIFLLQLSAIFIAVTAQIQFNEEFLEATNIRKRVKDHGDEDTIESRYQERRKYTRTARLCLKGVVLLRKVLRHVENFVQMHLSKIVVLVLIVMSIYIMSALHLLVLVLALVALLLEQRRRGILLKVCTLVVAVHVVQWMLVHLVFERKQPSARCHIYLVRDFTKPKGNATLYGAYVEWGGFFAQKWTRNGTATATDEAVEYVIRFHIGFILLSTAFVALNRYLQFRAFLKGRYRRQIYVMYPEVKRADADYNVKSCAKFLINYFFYKFGVEICFIFTTILVAVRWDGYGLLYLIWLFALFSLNRKTLAKMWPLFLYYTFIIILIQYAMLLNIPPEVCVQYPWFTGRKWRIVQGWLLLPDPVYQVSESVLMWDAVLLFLLTRQRVVFSIEKKYGAMYPAGRNGRPEEDIDDPDFINPVPDYVTFVRSWLDIGKKALFVSVMWVALTVMFHTANSINSLFSIGYIIACFIMYWRGEDFYLYSTDVMYRAFNGLIAYTLGVMFCKLLLQFFVNMFVRGSSFYTCLALRALSTTRLSLAHGPAARTHAVEAEVCNVALTSIELDVCCFAMLLIARRAVMTYYFVHVINDTKAVVTLSSRGAAIFDTIRLREIAAQEKKEIETIENLTIKMDALRYKQYKLQQHPLFVSPESHYDAIRAGDYFMFDEREIQEEDLWRAAEEKRLGERRRRRVERGLQYDGDSDDEGADVEGADVEGDDPEGRRLPRRVTVAEYLAETKVSMLHAVRVVRERRGQTSPDDELDLDSEEEEEEEDKEGRMSERKDKDKDGIEDNEVDEGTNKENDKDGKDNEENKTRDENNDKPQKKKKRSSRRCIAVWFTWMYYFFDSTVATLSVVIDGFTEKFRKVDREIRREKKRMLITGALRGYRDTSKSPWTPEAKKVRRQPEKDYYRFESTYSPRGMEFQMALQDTAQRAQFRFARTSRRWTAASLLRSIWFLVLAHSEMLCYFFVVLHQMMEPNIVSIVPTVAVLLWGTLSVPRPSRTFWVALLSYTEVVVVLKSVFEFINEPLREEERTKEWRAMRTIGLYVDRSGALDLCLLMAILFHRYRMRKFGLWDDHKQTSFVYSGPRRNKTLPYYPEYVEIKDSKYKGKNVRRIVTGVKSTKYYPRVLILVMGYIRGIAARFYYDLLTSPTRHKVDVYCWLFFLEAVSFLLILFGISSFSVMERNWIWYLSKSRIPLSIFILLFGQFLLILVDRIIYDRKSVIAKLVFQHLYIVAVHAFLFIFLPFHVGRQVSERIILQIFYFTKCAYFVISAYQIRCGYAIYEHGYLFRKKYGIFHNFFHQGYMLLPYFLELRNTIDWMATDTSFTYMEYFKMEDVYNTVYQVKCKRTYEKTFVKKRGEKKDLCSAVTVGGGVLLLIVVLVWMPLILLRARQDWGVANPPFSAAMELSIEKYPVLYSGSAHFIRKFTGSEWNKFEELYKNKPSAVEYLEYFDPKDLVIVKMPLNSGLWDVTQETRQLIIDDLRSDAEVLLRMEWRASYRTGGTLSDLVERPLPKGHPARAQLADLIAFDGTPVPDTPVTLPLLLPKFWDFTLGSQASSGSSASDAFLTGDTKAKKAFRDMTLRLMDVTPPNVVTAPITAPNVTSGQMRFQAWRLSEVCAGTDWPTLQQLPEDGCDSIVVYVFSEKKFGFLLDYITQRGAFLIYVFVIMTLNPVFRALLRGSVWKLALTEMPYPDRMLELCHDIYAVRIAKNFDLEEDLFAKLIFLLRSPETLAMFTSKPVLPEELA